MVFSRKYSLRFDFGAVFVQFWSAEYLPGAVVGLFVVPAFCQLLNAVLFFRFDIRYGPALFDTCFVLCELLFEIGSNVFRNLFRYG